MSKIYTSIGLMSGTSMDGIDLALIESDGKHIIKRKKFSYKPYPNDLKKRLSDLIHTSTQFSHIKTVEKDLTLLHAHMVNDFLSDNHIPHSDIDLIAFHGHTIFHMPEKLITWQIGDGELLAKETGIDVVYDFRSKDVSLGGQGAPLVPIYHHHLLHQHPKPVAALNIGGISNITYCASNDENDIEAFDTCFGNAPFDDLMKEKLGCEFDKDGQLTQKGSVDFALADTILQNKIFHQKPPKSFDRDDFDSLLTPIKNLKNAEDALATFAYLHAQTLKINLDFLSEKPKKIFICGGGRKNAGIMDAMKQYLTDIEVHPIEEINFDGDAIEAEAFAFLGIRTLLNLPISFKKTTGISRPSTSGRIYHV